MDLSIIIVNWNSKDYLSKAIASVEAGTKEIEFEVIVIDSGSYDGCDEMLRRSYPSVRFIQSDINIGFAKANNEAFKVSSGRNILFLNPDTAVEGRAIRALYDHLEALPEAGIVGPKLLNTDGSIQTTCIRAFPTILNQVLESDLLRGAFPEAELWGMTPLLRGNRGATEVEAVSGACLMVRRHVYETVGMFSTDYFMYSEDMDLCLKVRKVGLKTYYVPPAVVVHHGGGSSSSQTGVNTFSSVMMLESRWRFFRNNRSIWYSHFYRVAMFVVCLVRIGLVLLVWPASGAIGRSFSGKSALRKWTANLRWTIGDEEWVKNY
jgi:N-acetylglucosaminyl-diphospho-decaprenol L-rhamnosyltransferase